MSHQRTFRPLDLAFGLALSLLALSCQLELAGIKESFHCDVENECNPTHVCINSRCVAKDEAARMDAGYLNEGEGDGFDNPDGSLEGEGLFEGEGAVEGEGVPGAECAAPADCSVPNAQPDCVNGYCVIKSCYPERIDCENGLLDGCERTCVLSVDPTDICDGLDNDCDCAIDNGAFLQTDPANCGLCEKQCPPANHAVAICVIGQCQLQCAPGFADANHDLADPENTDGCESNCLPDGDETCDGNDNDCNGKVDDGDICPAGQLCNSGSCSGVCSDDCSSQGEDECRGTAAYRTCDYIDQDACLDWGADQTCPAGQTCRNGSCGQPCTDACTPGAGQCVTRESARVCIADQDSDPCYEWGPETDCPPGKKCADGQCNSSCTDDCTENQQRCLNSSTAQTCSDYDGDPCWEWGGDETCGAGDECAGGSCACLPSCSGKACGDDGCGGECPPGCSPGQPCENGQCKALCLPPNIVLVVDKNKTMCNPNPDNAAACRDVTATTAWRRMINAVGNLADANKTARYALVLFAGAEETGVAVQLNPNNSSTIKLALENEYADGQASHFSAGLGAAGYHLNQRLPSVGQSYRTAVILITGNKPSGGDTNSQVVTSVQQLQSFHVGSFTYQVRVYPVGIDSGVDVTLMDDIAKNGNTKTATKSWYSASTQTDLNNALLDIYNRIEQEDTNCPN